MNAAELYRELLLERYVPITRPAGHVDNPRIVAYRRRVLVGEPEPKVRM